MAKIFKNRTEVPYFDYKDYKNLQRYINIYGQIESRKKTGLTEFFFSLIFLSFSAF